MYERFVSDVRVKSYGFEGLKRPFEYPRGNNLKRIKRIYGPQFPVFYGSVNKPSGKNVIMGPCFLPSTDIRKVMAMKESSLEQARAFFKESLRKGPTFQNVVCQGYPAEGNILMVLETFEYASFLGPLDEELLEETRKAAERAAQMCKNYQQLLGSSAEVQLFYTDEESNNNIIKETVEEARDKYLWAMRDRLKEKMKMRIEATYMPEFAERVFGTQGYTVAENFVHGRECAGGDVFSQKFNKEFEEGKINFLGLITPKSLDDVEDRKIEMDNGEPLYLGDPEILRNQLQQIRSNGNGSFYTSPLANLLLFTDPDLSMAYYGLTETKKCASRVRFVAEGLKRIREGLEERMFDALKTRLSEITGEEI